MAFGDLTVEAGGLFWRVFGMESGGRSGSPPLVILHGLFGSSDNWRTQASAFAGDRTVLVADMPNHGQSVHTESNAYPEIAELIWSALDHLPTEYAGQAARYALLGHSMGGKAAMTMAFQREERVASLIVADIAPKTYPDRHGSIFDAMEAVAAAEVERRGEADRIMAEDIPEKAVRMFLLKSLVPDGSGAYRWQLNLPGLRRCYDSVRGWPFSEDPATGKPPVYQGPTLFVVGGRSPYVSPEDRDRIGRFFPRYQEELIPDAGHWLHAEARETFVSIVQAFL